MSGGTKQRVAVLGTGVGSMTAVWSITSQPGWDQHFEIDVYQMGWRCGGKGAAGRNAALGNRIEEHGLHMWFGFYENAFEMIRSAYEELAARRPDYRFRSYRDAFTPRTDLFLQEFVEGRWASWHTTFPSNHEQPGDGRPIQSVTSLIEEAIEWGVELLLGPDVLDWLEAHVPAFRPTTGALAILERLKPLVEEALSAWHVTPQLLARLPRAVVEHLAHLRALAAPASLGGTALADLVALAAELLRWFTNSFEGLVSVAAPIRRAFILLDLGTTILNGLLQDGCFEAQSFDPLEKYDWMEWLRLRGASELCLASPWVRGLYDGPFAYMRGDTSQPSMSAAVAVRGQVRGFLGYKGAPMWMMNAGMGDTIFSPLYLVLRERGVRFHFFHAVRELVIDPGAMKLDAIRLGIQATANGDYVPTLPLGGLEVWPNQPRYEQLVEGAALQASGANLESLWCAWPDVATKTLRHGVDFDVCICGLSLASWPHVAPSLFAAEGPVADRWKALVAGVPQIPTQSSQLWLRRDQHALGWGEAPAMVGAYAQPFNTWCDLSGLLAEETWGEDGPRSLVYLCGPLRAPAAYPPPGDTAFVSTVTATVRTTTANWLSANGGVPWPAGSRTNEPAALDPVELFDRSNAVGWGRLEAQYSRANVDPSERYVLSPPRTVHLRMRAEESGVTHLVIAGDWLRTGLASGCVEAAAMGGLQASRVICGAPAVIPGDHDQWFASA